MTREEKKLEDTKNRMINRVTKEEGKGGGKTEDLEAADDMMLAFDLL